MTESDSICDGDGIGAGAVAGGNLVVAGCAPVGTWRQRDAANVVVGRTNIAIRAADDSEADIREESEGRVVIEAADAPRTRVWAAAPSPGADATAGVRAMRAEDTRVSDGNAAARALSVTGSEEGAGQRLSEALGL